MPLVNSLWPWACSLTSLIYQTGKGKPPMVLEKMKGDLEREAQRLRSFIKRGIPGKLGIVT